MSKRKIIIIVVTLLIVASVVTLLVNKNGEKPIAVETATVELQKIVETVTATGRIQPKTQVKISADVAAKIIKMEVKEGDKVKKGDFLVQLDQEGYLAEVERLEASLRSIEANAKLNKENMIKAEKDYHRSQQLFEKGLESQAGLDQTYAIAQVEKARFESALEQVEQAKAALKQARDALSKTTIYSPMDGTITVLNKEVGEIALGSQFQEDVIMIVADLTEMEALVKVDENDVVAVAQGDSATIEVDALSSVKYKGIVTEIANSATISGQGTASQKTEFEVTLTVINPDSKLRTDMTASGYIITEVKKEVVGVPIQCVTLKTPDQLKNNPLRKKGNVAIADSAEPVYTTDEDGFAQVVFILENDHVIAREVETGIQSDSHIEITQGLTTGETIVTGSYRAISQQLKNNTLVSLGNAETR
ncbi:MAG: efflux RND transporter periplasmic adaptor subunit [Candidatus Marinimicrobia bacterium]|nr:efflux RND transporter periplasmic adaptor subunit [Candidatus Neomarinimicrobiota bacterium]